MRNSQNDLKNYFLAATQMKKNKQNIDLQINKKL